MKTFAVINRYGQITDGLHLACRRWIDNAGFYRVENYVYRCGVPAFPLVKLMAMLAAQDLHIYV